MEQDWFSDAPATRDMAAQLVAQARRAGADVAEGVLSYGRESGLTYRDGEVTELEQAESLDLGLRVWVGDRVAYLSGNQTDTAGLKDLAEQAVARAKLLPAAPHTDLPQHPDTPTRTLEVDASEPDLPTLIARATDLYDTAMARAGIVNSDGGQASWAKGRTALVASNGLSVSRAYSRFSQGLSVVAGAEGAQVRAHDFSTATHDADVRAADALVQRATDRALAKVGAQPVASFVGDVVFDAPMAKSLIAGFLGAINGAAIAKGQSFLKTALGHALFAPEVSIVDDPSLPRGLASHAIDREGHVPEVLDLVRGGVLQTWLLDRRSAALLSLQSNGRASHAGGGTLVPAATNVRVSGGQGSQADLIAGVARGLLVTDMMGAGLNPLTGDYSRGAEGFLIENGQVGAPVQAMTVAGGMRAMFARLVLADDTDRNGSLHCPSFLVPDLQIAGRG